MQTSGAFGDAVPVVESVQNRSEVEKGGFRVRACPFTDVRLKENMTSGESPFVPKVTTSSSSNEAFSRDAGRASIDNVKAKIKNNEGYVSPPYSSPWASSYCFTPKSYENVPYSMPAPIIEFRVPLVGEPTPAPFSVGGAASPVRPKSNKISRTIELSELLPCDATPAANAAVKGPEGGESPARPQDPWATFTPGVAHMEDNWEWVVVEEFVGLKKGEEKAKEKEKVKEKELEKEKEKEKVDMGFEKGGEEVLNKEHGHFQHKWKEMLSRKLMEKEKQFPKEQETLQQGPLRRRKPQRGQLSKAEATKARAEELTRGVRALLFPGRLKRKHTAFVRNVSINTIANANSSRVRFEEEEKEKEKEKEKVEEYGSVQQQSYYRPCLFVFGAGSETGSEVLFKGGVLEQVGEGEPLPEPEKIRFLHRLGGRLQTAILGGSETLAGWARQFLGDGTKEVDGYFTTKGGRILNSQLPAGKLGLHGSQEVVLQGRLRGGGYSGGGKGVRGGGGNSVAAGDWTCGICNQTGCWNAKPTCYRCGAPRQPNQGFSGPASSGGWDMGGRYQGGVGSGMGGSRVVGPTGRDQSSVPGGNPTHRKGPQPGGKGRNKVGGDTGAGVGFGFGTGGGLVGGGGGGDNGNAFAWLGGGGGVGNPLPPGMVMSERDRYLVCVEQLKGLLKDGREMEDYVKFWEERLPAKPAPAPVKTPTEAQRAEVFAQLTKRQDGLLRRVKDGQGRVEAAREKVRQEEAALEELQRELKGVSDQVDAHRAENLRRAEEAKAPRVDEVGSDMELEAGSSSGGEVGVNQVAGKRRKVVRQNRFLGNRTSKEDLWQFLNGMSDSDKDWLKKQFLSEVGSGGGCADHTLVGDVVELDKVELNARAPLTPTQEDVAETPCG